MGTFPRKILVSPGYGTGWSSWCNSWCNNSEAAQLMAEYKPIIEFLDNGGDNHSKEFRDLVETLEEEIEEKFGVEIYIGGARQLKVVEVNGPYRIEEYDGSESVTEQDDSSLWFY